MTCSTPAHRRIPANLLLLNWESFIGSQTEFVCINYHRGGQTSGVRWHTFKLTALHRRY